MFRTSQSKAGAQPSSKLARSTVVGDVFEHSRGELLWLAEALLGKRPDADACLADALVRADGAGFVAPDWRDLWAKRCVALLAIERDRTEIKRIAASYNREIDRTSSPRSLNADDKRLLRTLSTDRISQKTNGFERAVLIMHGYLGFSIQDCAVSLDCHRSLIEPACSNAFSRIFREEIAASIVQQTVETPGLSTEAA